jgi:DNA (cytosine-5)-methyltransferase 1
LISPFIAPAKTWGGGGNGPRSIEEPMRTVTPSKRGEFAVIEPFIVRHGHYSTITGAGLREGCGAGTFRGQPLGTPLGTVCATNDKHLVAPIITKHYGGVVGHGVDRALGTVTSKDHHAVTAAFITKFYNTTTGAALSDPLPTVTAGGGRGGGHLAEVRALLERFAAAPTSQNQDLFDPLHTVTSKARFGLVVVGGETYQIADIGMRMLQPHELFAAQGFPGDYDITPEFNGKPLTKTLQTELAGNSVCPQVAAALVAANLGGAAIQRAA